MIGNGKSPRTYEPVNQRPTSWWLSTLRRRAERRDEPTLDLSRPVVWASETERRAAWKFFNAAYRAEESGLRQAHEIADEVRSWDPELAEVLRLYGEEEGWHRELLTAFLKHVGGQVEPMGRVTRTLYRLYARAERMETIVLTNLMFETIGSTTYRLALGRIREPSVRQMLTILTRDESFHVPLNVHFLKSVLARSKPSDIRRLRVIYYALFFSLVALPLASRPKAQAFDHIGTLELARAYAAQLGALFGRDPELPFSPPRWFLFLLGATIDDAHSTEPAATSVQAAERAARREDVEVTAL